MVQLKLKSAKRHADYYTNRVDTDNVELTSVQVVDRERGLFRLSEEGLNNILEIEEVVVQCLSQQTLKIAFQEDNFVSSIAVTKKDGQVFKMSQVDGQSISSEWVNMTVRPFRVKVMKDRAMLEWELVDIQPCPSPSDSTSESSESDSISSEDYIKEALLERTATMKERIVEIVSRINELDMAVDALITNDFEGIDALELKVNNYFLEL